MRNFSCSIMVALTPKFCVCRTKPTWTTLNAGHCIRMYSWTLATMLINPSHDWQVCSCNNSHTFSPACLLVIAAIDSLGHCDLLAVLLCLSQAALAQRLAAVSVCNLLYLRIAIIKISLNIHVTVMLQVLLDFRLARHFSFSHRRPGAPLAALECCLDPPAEALASLMLSLTLSWQC